MLHDKRLEGILFAAALGRRNKSGEEGVMDGSNVLVICVSDGYFVDTL